MQPKRSPLILATVALGVLALGGLAYVLLSPGGSGPAPANTAQAAAPTPTPKPSVLWVATRDIPPRTRLTGQLVSAYMRRVAYTGKDGAPKDAIQSPADIANEITSETIYANSPVTQASFTPALQRVVPANIAIPNGLRAVAIYVDPTETAAGLVDVGDRVDVIAVHRLTLEKAASQQVVGASSFSAGRLIGSDLEVLAVDKSISAPAPTPTPVPGTQPAAVDPNAPPPTPTPPPPPANAQQKIRVLLAAPVDIATRLVAAGDQGTLHVTIRNPVDGDQTASPEAHAYPSRVVAIKNAGGGGSSKSSNTASPSSLMGPSIPMPTLPPPAMPTPLPPVNLAPVAAPTPAGPPSSDVTVIRGTEKTRVIVPQR